jgi:hypothetical protein
VSERRFALKVRLMHTTDGKTGGQHTKVERPNNRNFLSALSPYYLHCGALHQNATFTSAKQLAEVRSLQWVLHHVNSEGVINTASAVLRNGSNAVLLWRSGNTGQRPDILHCLAYGTNFFLRICVHTLVNDCTSVTSATQDSYTTKLTRYSTTAPCTVTRINKVRNTRWPWRSPDSWSPAYRPRCPSIFQGSPCGICGALGCLSSNNCILPCY